TFNLAAGTASLDVAAGAAVNVDANLTVTAATSLDEAVAMSSKAPKASPTFTTKITTPIIDLTGGQIAFPAIAVPSADPNTLDDFEKGAWTPGVSFGGASVDVAYNAAYTMGVYTKIGNRVHANGFMILTNKGISIGTALITGLPFTVVNTESGASPAALRLNIVTFADTFQGNVVKNTATVALEEVLMNGTLTQITNADFANTSQVMVSVSYSI
ncbi:MAG: hypothetical protein ABID54_10705, partial [Pseudomonadota bacterium]